MRLFRKTPRKCQPPSRASLSFHGSISKTPCGNCVKQLKIVCYCCLYVFLVDQFTFSLRKASFPFHTHYRLAYLGYKRPLTQSDLWTLTPQDQVKRCVERLQKFWQRELDKMKRSLFYSNFVVLSHSL